MVFYLLLLARLALINSAGRSHEEGSDQPSRPIVKLKTRHVAPSNLYARIIEYSTDSGSSQDSSSDESTSESEEDEEEEEHHEHTIPADDHDELNSSALYPVESYKYNSLEDGPGPYMNFIAVRHVLLLLILYYSNTYYTPLVPEELFI